MTPDMMSPDMRKLENSNEDPDAAIQNDPFNGGPVKIILRNIPMCFAKSCNDESKEIMEGAVNNLYEKWACLVHGKGQMPNLHSR